jgi:glycosyltransferase involved in cell wall biosynthesis
MRINIIHYHLYPGGVTRIIQSQINSIINLPQKHDITLITGHCPNPDIYHNTGIQLIINKELSYLEIKDNSKSEINDLSNSLREFLYKTINKNDIIHFHNLNLGKNPVLTYEIFNMAKDGYKVLNHCHDFAEDRIPNLKFLKTIIEEHFGEEIQTVLYPALSNYLYVTLNSFDLMRLERYGIEERRRFLLPNPVDFESKQENTDKKQIKVKICNKLSLNPSKILCTYPVRVIRRKNIGEYILLAALFSDKAQWLVTQAPKNPVEIPDYNRWKTFCYENKIPVYFEAGTKVNFEQLIRATDFCITTSIQEGFGMSYMEPWLMDTPVVGRNLFYITKDLKEAGIKFPLLYDKLMVRMNSEIIDFKKLSPNDQMLFIKDVNDNPEKGEAVFKLNPRLRNFLQDIPGNIITHNKNIITETFSSRRYGEKLNGIYKALTG